MTSSVGFDWLSASHDARRLLYRHIKRLIDTSALTWSRVFRDALGEAGGPGVGYEDNFRAGRISRQKAARLYSWLQSAHSEIAEDLDRDLADLGQSLGAVWERFIASHGRFEDVEVVPLNDARPGLVAFARDEPLASRRIRLGEPFCFRIRDGSAGAVLALQSVDRGWHALPLSADSLSMQVGRGLCWTPGADGGATPEALAEESDAGRHRFLFIVASPGLIRDLELAMPADRQLRPEELGFIAEHLQAASGWRLLRINVLFVS